MRGINILLPGIGALSFLVVSCASLPKGAKPVAPFDIKRYTGTWYEIARKGKSQNGLDNTTCTYFVDKKGRVIVENRGYNRKSGKWQSAKGRAKLVNQGKEARLKVSYFWPFHSPYTIIGIDPEYQNALVIGKDRTFLWLLSKEKEMPSGIRQRYLKIAEDLGIRTENLIWVKHEEPLPGE